MTTPDQIARRPFLTAEWRYLVMLNYEIPPAVLEPLVPQHTVLDLFEGRALASIVGFRFLNTRVLGVPVPFHRDFDEVNLRFYVKRPMPDGSVRRGSVVIEALGIGACGDGSRTPRSAAEARSVDHRRSRRASVGCRGALA